jgi:DNA-binding ferritin-like protein
MVIQNEFQWEVEAEQFCECHKMLNSQQAKLQVKETGGVLAWQ